MTQEQIISQLEALVDANSLSNILTCLGLVCHEKAEHLLVQWQDNTSAQTWERAGRKICHFSTNKELDL